MDQGRLEIDAAALGCSVDELIHLIRQRQLAALSPEDRKKLAEAQKAAIVELEAAPLDGAEARLAARQALPRPVSYAAPICNRCGRTRSQRDLPYPLGWAVPPVQVKGEEMTEDEVPLACCRWLEIGSPEDKAYREIECLRWARKTGWVATPDPPPDPHCKFCRRLKVTECLRDVEAGSAEDKAARALECSMVASDLE